MTIAQDNISIVLPSKNEAESLISLLPELCARFPRAEIIVVNDGSTDRTDAICQPFPVKVISHPYSMGNGAAVKTGARAAKGDVIVLMDADGQHKPEDIQSLLDTFETGFDMVVGARTYHSQSGVHRAIANKFYNRLATWMTNQRVLDLTSGFRVIKAGKFRKFLYLLPNGFSYPTTITMAFFRAGHSVAYVPITALKRVGSSHIRIVRDGLRFALIILKIGTLYSPFKLFLPVSAGFFTLGLGYYIYTFVASGRFTNMSALLFITAVLAFLIGIVSEQITVLVYKDSDN